jgi:hypothetical protein
MSELGLIVIWPNYLQHIDVITSKLGCQFTIIEHYDIEWNKKTLYQNFYRFYGDRLSTKSIKEKAVDSSEFRLIIFEDFNPRYVFRSTARGVEKVNANFFDLKKFFRKKFHTRFGIHGSNDEVETNRDLSLLLGLNVEDYRIQYQALPPAGVTKIHRDVTGIDGWDSLESFFYFMNAIESYVLLSNFNDFIPNLPSGNDIDILVLNRKKFALFANAVKVSKGTERSNYQIVVNGQIVELDLRYVGDNYSDIHWQRDCMNTRQLHSQGFYVLSEENQKFLLLYHALIHKVEMPKKYQKFFINSKDRLKIELYEFMYNNSYHMVEPKDITLFFNKKNGGDIKFSRPRRLRNKKSIIGFLKIIFFRLNNLVHFRRGPD